MATVRDWAGSNSFDYQLLDDSFFAYAPEWFRAKANDHVCPITDIARLVFARELISRGYERTIWMDADLLVFDPDNLILTIEKDFMFCDEVWMTGERQISHRVNNSISVFCKENAHLDFFIDACI